MQCLAKEFHNLRENAKVSARRCLLKMNRAYRRAPHCYVKNARVSKRIIQSKAECKSEHKTLSLENELSAQEKVTTPYGECESQQKNATMKGSTLKGVQDIVIVRQITQERAKIIGGKCNSKQKNGNQRDHVRKSKHKTLSL